MQRSQTFATCFSYFNALMHLQRFMSRNAHLRLPTPLGKLLPQFSELGKYEQCYRCKHSCCRPS